MLHVDDGSELEPRRDDRLDGDAHHTDIYDLADRLDPDRYAGVIIGTMADQEYLFRHRHALAAYLHAGRVVVWCGQLFRRWLPGCSPFIPAPLHSVEDYRVKMTSPHPIYHGVDPEELTFRHGVAGFFARGHHPVPHGATVLAELGGGQPITYAHRLADGGTVLAHAGASLHRYSTTGTTSRLAPQLFRWIRDEANRA